MSIRGAPFRLGALMPLWSGNADSILAQTQGESVEVPRLVLVGASGGEGFCQLMAFVHALPADLPAAVLIVLHRPIESISHLDEVLGRRTKLPVRVAREWEPLKAGVCYVGKPARHLSVAHGGLAALKPDHLYRNRTVDLLFHSAAQSAGAGSIGIVFAGALADGSKGLAELVRAGGRALVQDPDRIGDYGIPSAALRTTPQAEVLASPERIAQRVVELLADDPLVPDCAGSKPGGAKAGSMHSTRPTGGSQ